MAVSQLDQLAAADLPHRFGRYELQSILGEGGMARVFRAELLGPAGFRKQVALKVIKAKARTQARRLDVEAFIREARLGGLLKHPNIVDVYELGEAEEQLFIAMEVVDGMTVHDLIREGRAPPPTVVVEIATCIAAGLASAHALSSEGLPAGLVHRDLKPSNVLLSWAGEVKVADFGIAVTRRGELAEGSDEGGSLVGTLSYMSPEQLLGEPLDGRSDLFSLGLLVAELATSSFMPRHYLYKRLKAGGNLRAPVVTPDSLAPVDAVVPGLASIVLRCLQPIPEARYPNADAVLEALDLVRGKLGPEPRLRSWLPPSVRPPQVATVADETTPFARDLTEETATNAESSTAFVAGPRARTNLGPPLDSFVGRESELAALGTLFEDGARLVTVKATGGAGKTRFASRYARGRWQELPGGAWFVDLTEARTPTGVLHATAVALGVALRGADFAAIATQLGHSIAARGPVLLLLDNFEQVVEYARETVGLWREMAPEASFLVTSREPLKLAGEQVFPLDPLPQDAGVALFEVRARAVGAQLSGGGAARAVLGKIVETLDGLPLAIELAAARVPMLSPEQLLERLSDRFELLRGGRRGETDRQSTLRGLIRWSWQLLAPWEQSALAQLSVFRDGFFMEAAEDVLDLSAWPDAPWSLDVVGSLFDKSLLRSWQEGGRPRFGMYVSIQQYAAEKLDSSSGNSGDLRGTANSRHAACYARFGSEEFLESLSVHGGVERRQALALELENLVAGVDAALAAEDVEVAAGCALAAAEFFVFRGPFAEGVALLERVVAEPVCRATRARLMMQIGVLFRFGGRRAEAREHYDQALALAIEVGNRQRVGFILGRIGNLHLDHGHISEAQEFYEQGLSIARDVGDRRMEGICLGHLAAVARGQGRNPEVLELFEKALAIAREIGDCRFEGHNLVNMAQLHVEQGRIAAALEHLQKALVIVRSVGDRRAEGIVLGNLGDVLSEQSDFRAAEVHFRQGISICDEAAPYAAAVFRGCLALLRAQQGAFEEARSLLGECEPQMRREHGVHLGEMLCKKAGVEHLAGASDAAATALAEAESIAIELDAGPESGLGKALAEARAMLAK